MDFAAAPVERRLWGTRQRSTVGAFAEAEALLLDRFADVTLAELARDFARRHAERRAVKE